MYNRLATEEELDQPYEDFSSDEAYLRDVVASSPAPEPVVETFDPAGFDWTSWAMDPKNVGQTYKNVDGTIYAPSFYETGSGETLQVDYGQPLGVMRYQLDKTSPGDIWEMLDPATGKVVNTGKFTESKGFFGDLWTDLSSIAADVAPVVQYVPVVGQVVQAINAINAARSGDIAQGIASLAGAGQGLGLGDFSTIRNIASAAAAIENKDPLALAVAGMNLTGTQDIGGFTAKEITAANAVVQGLQSDNLALAVNGAAQLTNSPNIALAGAALNFYDAAKAGNPAAMLRAGEALTGAINEQSRYYSKTDTGDETARLQARYGTADQAADRAATEQLQQSLVYQDANDADTVDTAGRLASNAGYSKFVWGGREYEIPSTPATTEDVNRAIYEDVLRQAGPVYTTTPTTADVERALSEDVRRMSVYDASSAKDLQSAGAQAQAAGYNAFTFGGGEYRITAGAPTLMAQKATTAPYTVTGGKVGTIPNLSWQQQEALDAITQVFGTDISWLDRGYLAQAANRIRVGEKQELIDLLQSYKQRGEIGNLASPVSQEFINQESALKNYTPPPGYRVAAPGEQANQIGYTDEGVPVNLVPQVTTTARRMTQEERAAYDASINPFTGEPYKEGERFIEAERDILGSVLGPVGRGLGKAIEDVGQGLGFGSAQEFGANLAARGRALTPVISKEQYNQWTAAINDEPSLTGKLLIGAASGVTKPLGVIDAALDVVGNQIPTIVGAAVTGGGTALAAAPRVGMALAEALGVKNAINAAQAGIAGNAYFSSKKSISDALVDQGYSREEADKRADFPALFNSAVEVATEAGPLALVSKFASPAKSNVRSLVLPGQAPISMKGPALLGAESGGEYVAGYMQTPVEQTAAYGSYDPNLQGTAATQGAILGPVAGKIAESAIQQGRNVVEALQDQRLYDSGITPLEYLGASTPVKIVPTEGLPQQLTFRPPAAPPSPVQITGPEAAPPAPEVFGPEAQLGFEEGVRPTAQQQIEEALSGRYEPPAPPPPAPTAPKDTSGITPEMVAFIDEEGKIVTYGDLGLTAPAAQAAPQAAPQTQPATEAIFAEPQMDEINRLFQEVYQQQNYPVAALTTAPAQQNVIDLAPTAPTVAAPAQDLSAIQQAINQVVYGGTGEESVTRAPVAPATGTILSTDPEQGTALVVDPNGNTKVVDVAPDSKPGDKIDLAATPAQDLSTPVATDPATGEVIRLGDVVPSAPSPAPAPSTTETRTQAPAPSQATITTAAPSPAPSTTETKTEAPAPAPTATETKTEAPAPAETKTEVKAPSPAPTITETKTEAPAPAEIKTEAPAPTTETKTEAPAPAPVTTEAKTEAPAPAPTTTEIKTEAPAPAPTATETKTEAPAPTTTETKTEAPAPAPPAQPPALPPSQPPAQPPAPPPARPPAPAPAPVPVSAPTTVPPVVTEPPPEGDLPPVTEEELRDIVAAPPVSAPPAPTPPAPPAPTPAPRAPAPSPAQTALAQLPKAQQAAVAQLLQEIFQAPEADLLEMFAELYEEREQKRQERGAQSKSRKA